MPHRHDLLPPLAAHGHLALTEPELAAWGSRLGRQIDPPLVVTLDGDLGAGKTTLARAICAGYGVTEAVTSPTFALVHQYEAHKSPVYHIDLFRLDSAAALQNIGWDDIMQADALVLVEWPERAVGLLPANHLPIELRHIEGDPDRRVLYAGGHLGGMMVGR
ncbi:MAG TPA: tRNA (adenosine(37)-N6)-threonylcarbamoyltransferase complex ATPase subunit type 1 TsaE [Gemmatimonadaceae bacterium]|nr:tRNA (adenosine(37)-N6)-threonylcarbamoyltransferase complex ATPase subunit type 1 TsaE [Gemmatimonadaceae bacterium]